MKILIIEDNEQIVDVLTRYLKKAEYETAVIHDGKEALPTSKNIRLILFFWILCCQMSTALQSASKFAKNQRFRSL